ncbi:Na(+)/citrate cotransporter-like isoform X2 [Uloborus diversus]|uniref:Na(+)/citrate cotransporter-like isoform X2 n=1 Tax=Uloborus diversus TaxID=327109 RepID=UPI002409C7D4|nr:Na(+)/citrate cotransporter-like isoform X2 [Uloborus diversus]
MSCRCLRFCRRINARLCIYVLSILLPFVLSPLAASAHKESKCSYVTILVASYWLLEPVPVAVTALLPVVLFPLLGVASSAQVCSNYMKEPFLMFIGGFIVAIAVEECKLHERIALKVLLLIGTEIKWLLLGFMLTTMFLSMWLNNLATTLLMVPIVEAVIGEIDIKNDHLAFSDNNGTTILPERKQTDDPGEDNFLSKMSLQQERKNSADASTIKVTLLLSVCYAANIGGTGSLSGASANIVLKGLMEELYPDSDDITFATWMMYNIPGMVLCVLIGYVYLWLVYIRFSKHNFASESKIKDIISKRYSDLGSLTKIGDSVPAIGIAFLMFFLPSRIGDWNSPRILEWKTAQVKVPWGVLILVGGGFALADTAQKSGLSKLLGENLMFLAVLPPGAMVVVVCLVTAMITEIITNVTSVTVLLPIFSQVAVSIGVNPLFLMLPITLAASYAFMLPVATPPNAIAFESGNMKTLDMAKPGLAMNLICCAVQLFMINTLGAAMFNLREFPDWANRTQVFVESVSNSVHNSTFLNMTLPSVNNL